MAREVLNWNNSTRSVLVYKTIEKSQSWRILWHDARSYHGVSCAKFTLIDLMYSENNDKRAKVGNTTYHETYFGTLLHKLTVLQYLKPFQSI